MQAALDLLDLMFYLTYHGQILCQNVRFDKYSICTNTIFMQDLKNPKHSPICTLWEIDFLTQPLSFRNVPWEWRPDGNYFEFQRNNSSSIVILIHLLLGNVLSTMVPNWVCIFWKSEEIYTLLSCPFSTRTCPFI